MKIPVPSYEQCPHDRFVGEGLEARCEVCRAGAAWLYIVACYRAMAQAPAVTVQRALRYEGQKLVITALIHEGMMARDIFKKFHTDWTVDDISELLVGGVQT